MAYRSIDQGRIDAYFNMLKLRVGANGGNAAEDPDKAIADAYGNKFYIPLDSELLEGHTPFYQNALGDHLEYVSVV